MFIHAQARLPGAAYLLYFTLLYFTLLYLLTYCRRSFRTSSGASTPPHRSLRRCAWRQAACPSDQWRSQGLIPTSPRDDSDDSGARRVGKVGIACAVKGTGCRVQGTGIACAVKGWVSSLASLSSRVITGIACAVKGWVPSTSPK